LVVASQIDCAHAPRSQAELLDRDSCLDGPELLARLHGRLSQYEFMRGPPLDDVVPTEKEKKRARDAERLRASLLRALFSSLTYGLCFPRISGVYGLCATPAALAPIALTSHDARVTQPFSVHA